ncbi:MAG: hypothetical protein AABW85_00830, partial [archaeon]
MKLPIFRYPKLLLLSLSFAMAYVLLNGAHFVGLRGFLGSLGLVGAFFAGLMYVYGFTAAYGTAIFLILAKGNGLALAGLVAGTGALLGDMLIFKFLRHSFSDELRLLSNEKFFVALGQKFPAGAKNFFLPAIGGLIIASPLPDELGVLLLAASPAVSTRNFAALSFILNTV